MKAISLHQPWASLVALQQKRIETRSWPANYTGPLAIHAAKRPVRLGEIDLNISDTLFNAGISRLGQLPLGCIVATCTLARFYQITTPPRVPELWFGNYEPGRWAWVLEDIRAMRTPLPWTGSQKWFSVPDELLEVL